MRSLRPNFKKSGCGLTPVLDAVNIAGAHTGTDPDLPIDTNKNLCVPPYILCPAREQTILLMLWPP